MIVLGIDPGPTWCGCAAYDTAARRVRGAGKVSIADALATITCHTGPVVIERVQSSGISGATLLTTSEVVGRLQQRALDTKHETCLLYRREVLRVLDVTGRGTRDAMVRARLVEMFGGSREVAFGRKKAPGPLYGVTGDALSALAVAIAWAAVEGL